MGSQTQSRTSSKKSSRKKVLCSVDTNIQSDTSPPCGSLTPSTVFSTPPRTKSKYIDLPTPPVAFSLCIPSSVKLNRRPTSTPPTIPRTNPIFASDGIDKAHIMAEIEQDVGALASVDENLLIDHPDVVLDAVKLDSTALKYVSRRFRESFLDSNIHIGSSNYINFWPEGIIDVTPKSKNEPKMQIDFQTIREDDSSCTALTDFRLLTPTPEESLLVCMDTDNSGVEIFEVGDEDAKGALGRKYTLLNRSEIPGGGRLEIQFMPVTVSGFAGIGHDMHYLSSGGDSKYNIVLEWPNFNYDDSESIYLEIVYKTDEIIRKADGLDHTYSVGERKISLYFPNKYFSLNRESGLMEQQTMETGYPKLSSFENDGTYIFTLQFYKSRKVFYDPISQTRPSYGEFVVINEVIKQRNVKAGVPVKKIVNLVKQAFAPDILSLLLTFTNESGGGNLEAEYSQFYCSAGSNRKKIVRTNEELLDGSFLVTASKRENEEKNASLLAFFSRQKSKFVYTLYFAQPINDAAKDELQALMDGEWDIELFFQILSNLKEDPRKEELELFRRDRMIRKAVQDKVSMAQSNDAGENQQTPCRPPFLLDASPIRRNDHSVESDPDDDTVEPDENLGPGTEVSPPDLDQTDESIVIIGSNDYVAESSPSSGVNVSPPDLNETDDSIASIEPDDCVTESPPSLGVNVFNVKKIAMMLFLISVWFYMSTRFGMPINPPDEPVKKGPGSKAWPPMMIFLGGPVVYILQSND